MTASENKFFPCLFVEHENHNSIILSDFYFFDDYFGDKGGGGYTVEKLAKKLVKENGIKSIKFDSEAGMFCAYSTEIDKLVDLCRLLQDIVGDGKDCTTTENTEPLIPLEVAEAWLVKGFVQGTDRESQEKFLENVPFPALTQKQSEYLQAIENGTENEKIYAAKRINSEARTKTRRWNHYLSHPKTVTLFLEALDKETSPKVYQELLGALVFICKRHLPDLRALPCFLESLNSKISQNRLLGLLGLPALYDFPMEAVLKLQNDKSEKIRKQVESFENQKKYKIFPAWMFSQEYEKRWTSADAPRPMHSIDQCHQVKD
jgi:hypothetical protein